LEEELHDKEQMNQMILNTSSDVIIKISSKWKILEFNPAAEFFFEKKHKETVDQNFIQLFVPNIEQKRIENELNKLMKEGHNSTFKMPLFVKGGNIVSIDWAVNIHLDSLKQATEMIIIAKNNKTHE
jgi:two-component system, chemotaxis family, CheB/CheR fusion protein